MLQFFGLWIQEVVFHLNQFFQLLVLWQKGNFFIMWDHKIALGKWAIRALIRPIIRCLLGFRFFRNIRPRRITFFFFQSLVYFFCIFLNFHSQFFDVGKFLLDGGLFFVGALQVLKIYFCFFRRVKKIVLQFLDFFLDIILFFIFRRFTARKIIFFWINWHFLSN